MCRLGGQVRDVPTEVNERRGRPIVHRLIQYAVTDVIEEPPGPSSAECIKSPGYIWQLGDGFRGQQLTGNGAEEPEMRHKSISWDIPRDAEAVPRNTSVYCGRTMNV